jgi:BolA protein
MNINQLIEIIEKKILSQDCVSRVTAEDKSFLHKNHKSNTNGKYHILLSIESRELKKKNKLYSTRLIYKILDNELKNHIHSIQIKLI